MLLERAAKRELRRILKKLSNICVCWIIFFNFKLNINLKLIEYIHSYVYKNFSYNILIVCNNFFYFLNYKKICFFLSRKFGVGEGHIG